MLWINILQTPSLAEPAALPIRAETSTRWNGSRGRVQTAETQHPRNCVWININNWLMAVMFFECYRCISFAYKLRSGAFNRLRIFSLLFHCIFIRRRRESKVMSWIQTPDVTNTCSLPLLSQQDASGRCTFSMTILCRGKGAWICSSRKHFTDYAELLWLTGAAYGRQFDVRGFRFT